jgi:hypothetical protein
VDGCGPNLEAIRLWTFEKALPLDRPPLVYRSFYCMSESNRKYPRGLGGELWASTQLIGKSPPALLLTVNRASNMVYLPVGVGRQYPMGKPTDHTNSVVDLEWYVPASSQQKVTFADFTSSHPTAADLIVAFEAILVLESVCHASVT